MKKFFLVIFLAMAVFSSLAFGQGVSGENVFDMVQINAPVGLPISIAKGISDDAKVAMLSFQFPSKAQLLVGTASNMVAVATYGVGSFFSPLIMTTSGDLVGDMKEGWDSAPAVIFAASKGQNKALKLAEFGQIIAAKNDKGGKVFVLVNKNDELILFIATATGIEKAVTVAELSLYSYSDGGISINEETGVIHLVATTSFSFQNGYFNFVSIFEMNLDTFVLKKSSIFGWDDEKKYLATVSFGGVDGKNMVGQYDGQPFMYDLERGLLQVFPPCDDPAEEYSQAKGIILGDWLVGECWSSSIFFWNTTIGIGGVVDFYVDYLSILTVSGDKIVVQTGEGEFFLLTLKKYAKH